MSYYRTTMIDRALDIMDQSKDLSPHCSAGITVISAALGPRKLAAVQV
ncbi:MAG: hypothetical protein ACHRHE_21650 [Tepidisphaerales bacterium]